MTTKTTANNVNKVDNVKETTANNFILIGGVKYFKESPTVKVKKETVKKFGVINSIAFVLLTSDKPMTKEVILDKVLELNPDKIKDKKSMSQTVSVQCPTRLTKDKELAILTLFDQDGQRLYIADPDNPTNKKELARLNDLKKEVDSQKADNKEVKPTTTN